MAASGSPVRWHRDAVTVVLDDSLEAIDPSAPDVFSAAIAAWRKSGANLPSVSTIPGHHLQPGYQEGGSNENAVLFAKYGWPKAGAALAVTVLTFDDSGALVDADIVVNGGGRFFGVLDEADSSGDGPSVSIEGKGTSSGSERGPASSPDEPASTNAPSDAPPGDTHAHPLGTHPAARARFDLQNVLTHELGHFFGLDEDYDDPAATMYVETRPGETQKRVLTAADVGAITALYETPMLDEGSDKGSGCAGAAIAPGASADRAGAEVVGFGVALLGLGLAVRGRRSRQAARAGAGAMLAGLVVALIPPAAGPLGRTPRARGDATAVVLAADAQRHEGLIDTRLRLHIDACRTTPCPAADTEMVVRGGTIGKITQIVGGAPVPHVGEKVELTGRPIRRFFPLMPTAIFPNRGSRGHR